MTLAQSVMAELLPPETIELVLSLAYDAPGAEDVDVEKERERRRPLRTAALVCRRWRPVATAMLPLSIVVGSADELAALAMAHIGGTLNVGRTTCLTIACFAMTEHCQARLHALATQMHQLRLLRIACAAIPFGAQLHWPGQHMVVGSSACGLCVWRGQPSAAWGQSVMDVLEASTSFCHLSLLRCVELADRIGASFGARVETIDCGTAREPYDFGCRPFLLSRGPDGHLGRLRSLRFFGMDFVGAVEGITGFTGQAAASTCPALLCARIGLMNVYVLNASDQTACAVDLLNRLPRSCTRLVCEVQDLHCSVKTFPILARAVASAHEIGIETLIVVIRESNMAQAWLTRSRGVAALEQACAAKGVAVEVRI